GGTTNLTSTARTLGTTEDWGGGGRPEPAVELDQAGALGSTHPAAELDALCTFVKRIMQRLLESIVVDADRLEPRGPQAVPPQLLRRSRWRSEEHTSELQSRFDLVCRLLLA